MSAYLSCNVAVNGPLSVATRRRLMQISPLLVQRLELYESNLLVELRSRQVLSDSDYQRLNTETVNCRRNVLLINVLLRGSQQTWNRFVEALGETNHKELHELCAGKYAN